MYTDKAKKTWPIILVIALLIVLTACACFWYAHLSENESREEGAAAIRQTVEQTALQCYVVEGAYPPDIAYMEDHYGLQINHEDYYVTYEAFASNLPPTVKVTERVSDGSGNAGTGDQGTKGGGDE